MPKQWRRRYHASIVRSAVSPLEHLHPQLFVFGGRATLNTKFVCALSGSLIGFPVSASHSRAVLSADAVRYAGRQG